MAKRVADLLVDVLADSGHASTQCEALTMVAVQILGNDHAVAFAGSPGQLSAQRVQAGHTA